MKCPSKIHLNTQLRGGGGSSNSPEMVIVSVPWHIKTNCNGHNLLPLVKTGLIDLPKLWGGSPRPLWSLASYGPAVIVAETMPWQMKTDCDGEKTAQIPGESTLKTFNLPNYAGNFGLCRLPAAAAAAAARAGGRLLANFACRASCNSLRVKGQFNLKGNFNFFNSKNEL